MPFARAGQEQACCSWHGWLLPTAAPPRHRRADSLYVSHWGGPEWQRGQHGWTRLLTCRNHGKPASYGELHGNLIRMCVQPFHACINERKQSKTPRHDHHDTTCPPCGSPCCDQAKSLVIPPRNTVPKHAGPMSSSRSYIGQLAVSSIPQLLHVRQLPHPLYHHRQHAHQPLVMCTRSHATGCGVRE